MMLRFFEMSAEGKTPVGMEIARLIYETRKIDRLRLFVMTNAIAPADYDPDNDELPGGTTVEYHILGCKTHNAAGQYHARQGAGGNLL